MRVFVDIETSEDGRKILDLGALKDSGASLHTSLRNDLMAFLSDCTFLIAHNAIAHDVMYLQEDLDRAGLKMQIIDTLYLSALLFPGKTSHRLLKDDRIVRDSLNNPVSDAVKVRELFEDELAAFSALPSSLKVLYRQLLSPLPGFAGFFAYVKPDASAPDLSPARIIRDLFGGRICDHAPLDDLIRSSPGELAFCLSFLFSHRDGGPSPSLLPAWVSMKYPCVYDVLHLLCGSSCGQCPYCRTHLNPLSQLRRLYGYDHFQEIGGKPLQETAVNSALAGESMLVVLPTGSGKSMTFQLPALMAGSQESALSVVITPLQAIMGNQVQGLENKGIAEAVTVNSSISVMERKTALDRLRSGQASLLYISPESLHTASVRQILLERSVARVIVDEAHCLSAWGHDFRVDYLYIADFIRWLEQEKHLMHPIPVTCVTATARPRVIQDICSSFEQVLHLSMTVILSDCLRENLHFRICRIQNRDQKYTHLRLALSACRFSAVVYTSRTEQAFLLSRRLTEDGLPACFFHGKMDAMEKNLQMQNFLSGKCRIMCATNAFGMGVDKQDIGLIVLYDLPSSLEYVVQQAGRAGRNPDMQAQCLLLYDRQDADFHFSLFRQTQISIKQIGQIWSTLRRLAGSRLSLSASLLEIARSCGWTGPEEQVTAGVRTALALLDRAGYIDWQNNACFVYADSIQVTSVGEAQEKMRAHPDFSDPAVFADASYIVSSLIGRRYRARAGTREAEDRLDYIADRMGKPVREVQRLVLSLRDAGILGDSMDMSARLTSFRHAWSVLDRSLKTENYLLTLLLQGRAGPLLHLNYRELNDDCLSHGLTGCTERHLVNLVNFWCALGLTRRTAVDEHHTVLTLTAPVHGMQRNHQMRQEVCTFILKAFEKQGNADPADAIPFSVLQLKKAYEQQLSLLDTHVSIDDIQHSLLYLAKTGTLTLEGGFLVSYAPIRLHILKPGSTRFLKQDYLPLRRHYEQKLRQIHITLAWAECILEDPAAAREMLQDYFRLDDDDFLKLHFPREKAKELQLRARPETVRKISSGLSDRQKAVLKDTLSPTVIVSAGPGSGKTTVLVHLLASLLMEQENRSEQLLMLTYSRSAAIVFQKRLQELIGNAAFYVPVRTFHSYCFELLGQIGTLQDADSVIRRAAEMILQDEIEPEKITITSLVLDEAQDMTEESFALVCALKARNPDMRIHAVGDDDQTIYTFAGSSSTFMRHMLREEGAVMYELTENYRSCRQIVDFANDFAGLLKLRMKRMPLISAGRDREGEVHVIRTRSPFMEEPLLRDLLPCCPRFAEKGESCAVLVRTNEEALRIYARLRQAGIPAHAVQSNDSFDLTSLQECRYFLYALIRQGQDRVDAPDVPPDPVPRILISEARWDKALAELKSAFQRSQCLPAVLRLLDDFRATRRQLYFSDLIQFLHESRLEDDRGPASGAAVLVSTFHRAKGREFDHVFLTLSGMNLSDQNDCRVVYVGITRARKSLHIYTASDELNGFGGPDTKRREDAAPYPAPSRTVFYPSMSGVVLSAMTEKKEIETVGRCRSGDPLSLRFPFLTNKDGKPVCVLSAASQDYLARQQSAGFVFDRAEVRFIVSWKKKDSDEPMHWVLLPTLYLARQLPDHPISLPEGKE